MGETRRKRPLPSGREDDEFAPGCSKHYPQSESTSPRLRQILADILDGVPEDKNQDRRRQKRLRVHI